MDGAQAVTDRELYERDEATALAEQALQDLCEGARSGLTGLGSLLLYSGSAGQGKTSLLARLRQAAAREPSCVVLYSRGGEQQRNVPFNIVRQLLLPVLAKRTPEGRRELLDGSNYDLAAPALGLAAPAPGASNDPQGVQDALNWVVTQLAVREGPLLLIVDDLHWADPESLAWLGSFTSRIPGLPLLVAAAYRPEELEPEGAAIPAAANRGNLLKLRNLTPGAVEELLRSEFGAEDCDDLFCRQCWELTGGNPYDISQVVGKMKERQLDPVEESIPLLRDLVAAGRGPAIVETLERMPADTYRFALAAAVLDNEINPDVAASVAAVSPAAARSAVEQLREEGILREDHHSVSGHTVLEFCHPTIGTAIYQSMRLTAFRTSLHGQAAKAVLLAGGTEAAASRHLLEVLPEDDLEVVKLLRRAAEQHLAVGAPDAARRCLERALREPPADEDRADVLYELGCSTLLTAPDVTINHLRQALEANPGLSAQRRELATLRLSSALGHSNLVKEAAAAAAEEIERTEPGLSRTRLQAAYFMWRAFLREEPDGVERSRLLAELSDSLTGSDSGARAVRVLRAFDLTQRGEDSAEALSLAEQAFERGRLAQGIDWTNQVWGFEIPVLLGLTFVYNDRLDVASELFNQAAQEFELAGWSGGHLAFANFMRGLVLFRWGRLEEAEKFLRETLKRSDRLGRGTPLQWDLVALLCDTLMARGRIDQAVELAEEYAFKPPFSPVMVVPDAATLYGRLLVEQKRYKEAAEILSESARGLQDKEWHNGLWAPWAGPLALSIAEEEPERAREIATEALKRAMRIGVNSAVGSALRWCAAVNPPQQAVTLLRQAVEHLEQSPAAYELALALVDYGSALRRTGRPREAGDALGQGVQLAAQCGADGLVIRARSELAAAGASSERLHAIAARVLSEPERAVAEQAARGVPAQRIAADLGITQAVVAQRLASVYRKVGTGPEGLAAAIGLE